MKYYLALGTNLGDRAFNISKAVELLNLKGRTGKLSPIYRTSPVGMEGNPPDFFNLCLEFISDLAPVELIIELKKIETDMGRDTVNGHNRSRTIDIDIIIAENLSIDSPDLQLPHREMHKRLFVLIPLRDIFPEMVHPENGLKIDELIARLNNGDQKLEPVNIQALN